MTSHHDETLGSDPQPSLLTRRHAAALFAAVVGFGVDATAAKNKNKKKKRKKRKKRKNQQNGRQSDNGGQTIGASPHVALGAYVPKALDDASVRSAFSAAIGREPAFLVWYEGWSNGAFGANQRNTLAVGDEVGMTPVITWEPMDLSGPTIDQPAYRLSRIAQGDFDAYVDGWARGLAAYGKTVLLNFAHEMNGGWFPWGFGVNGSQPGDYIAAWRHIHQRFKAAGASNVRWVWTPNIVVNGLPATLNDVYPGDAYVDWLGMNGYNWGTSVYWASCPCQSQWQSFDQVFAETYRQLTALADKPIIIPETASSEDGGNKAAWITDALFDQLPNAYPRIRAISWFNKVATGLDTIRPGVVEATARVDWTISSSRKAQSAFGDAAQDAYYSARLLDVTS